MALLRHRFATTRRVKVTPNSTWASGMARLAAACVALSWSGIGQWRQGGLPLPLIVKFEVQETYAGRNTVDVRDYYLVLTSFF